MVGRSATFGRRHEAYLKQVDCLGKRLRLVVEGDDRKIVKLLIADPAQSRRHGRR